MVKGLPGEIKKKKLFCCPLKIWTLKICNQDEDYLVKLKRFFLSIYCFLQIFEGKICNQDILKVVIARSFKLGQLIENDD